MTPEIKKTLDLAHGYLDRLIRGLNMDDTSEAVQVRDAIKQARSAPTVQDSVAWWVTQMDMDGKIDSFAVTSDYDYAKSVCDLDIATPRPLIFGDTTPPAQPVVPDAMTSADIQEHIEYVAGWNDCRELTIQMRKS